MNKKAKAIFMHALTSVHAGTGSSASYIDLPIQREVSTQLPVIYASEVRGIFRANYFDKLFGNDGDDLGKLSEKIKKFVEIFGGGSDVEKVLKSFKDKFEKDLNEQDNDILKELEEQIEPSKSASSISFTDARILFFPVRSLKGIIVWVTSPFVLKRFERDIKTFGEELDIRIHDINGDEALVTDSSELIFDQAGEKKCVFDDFVLKPKEGFNPKPFEKFLPDSVVFEFFKKHVAVVNDDILKDLTIMGAEITPRIRINKEKGTVDSGALWYEENVPAEAIFYSLVLFDKEYDDIFNENSIVQIGGNASLARGIFKIKVVAMGGDEK